MTFLRPEADDAPERFLEGFRAVARKTRDEIHEMTPNPSPRASAKASTTSRAVLGARRRAETPSSSDWGLMLMRETPMALQDGELCLVDGVRPARLDGEFARIGQP
jgi:hypothetical protein